MNLTDPMEIKHALEKSMGGGALSKLAKREGVSRSTVTNAIKGKRPGSHLLQVIADQIGQPVYGTNPNEVCATKTNAERPVSRA